MDKLITDYNNNDALTVKLLDEFEIHILAVFNPDGYEFSFKVNQRKTYNIKYNYNKFKRFLKYLKNNRMWRKNRNPNNGRCNGVDLNRNFGYHWLSSGSSGTPCSEIYAV